MEKIRKKKTKKTEEDAKTHKKKKLKIHPLSTLIRASEQPMYLCP